MVLAECICGVIAHYIEQCGINSRRSGRLKGVIVYYVEMCGFSNVWRLAWCRCLLYFNGVTSAFVDLRLEF